MSQEDKRLVDMSQLIAEVRSRPALYEKTLDVDRDEKMAMWKEIGAAVYGDWNDVTKAEAYDRVLELQRKWRSVRDALNRELRHRRQGKTKNRKPYKYYSRLKFLVKGGGGGGGGDGDRDGDGDGEDDGDEQDYELNAASLDDDRDDHDDRGERDERTEPDPLLLITRRRKVARKKSATKVQKPSEQTKLKVSVHPADNATASTATAASIGSTAVDEDKDSDRLFLLSFAQELRKLPSHIRMWARAEIANVMQQAVSCNYNNRMPGNAGLEDHDGTYAVKQRRLSSD